MARIRTIKPEFPQSESMGNVSRDARLTFLELWTIADDEGRLRGNSRMLASLLFPYDDDAPQLIDTWLAELERELCIVRYKSGGQSYIQICNWLIHQKIDKPSKSKIPPIEEDSRILANPREASSEDQGSRTKDQGPKERTKDKPLSASPPDAYPEAFEATWKVYPSRPGASKKDSHKAWAARCKEGVSPEDLHAGVLRYANYVRHQRTEPQFIKQPATFFGPGEHYKADWSIEARASPHGVASLGVHGMATAAAAQRWLEESGEN